MNNKGIISLKAYTIPDEKVNILQRYGIIIVIYYLNKDLNLIFYIVYDVDIIEETMYTSFLGLVLLTKVFWCYI